MDLFVDFNGFVYSLVNDVCFGCSESIMGHIGDGGFGRIGHGVGGIGRLCGCVFGRLGDVDGSFDSLGDGGFGNIVGVSFGCFGDGG